MARRGRERKYQARFLAAECKDRVVHQPGSLNCYETVEEKAFLSRRSSAPSSFWEVLVLPSFPFSSLIPLNFFLLSVFRGCVCTHATQLSSALRSDARKYLGETFSELPRNDKRASLSLSDVSSNTRLPLRREPFVVILTKIVRPRT